MPAGLAPHRVIAFALAAFCTACATRSHAPETVDATRELRVKAGDEIRIVTTGRDRVSLQVQQVLEDRFLGVTLQPARKETRAPGIAVEIPYDEIALLEVTRFHPGLAASAAVFAVVTVGLGTLLIVGPPMPASP
jgi:hypothetical protein